MRSNYSNRTQLTLASFFVVLSFFASVASANYYTFLPHPHGDSCYPAFPITFPYNGTGFLIITVHAGSTTIGVPAKLIPPVDHDYGNDNGIEEQYDWDMFYAVHGFPNILTSATEACVGWLPGHAYNLCSCMPDWESKRGDQDRVTHGNGPVSCYGSPTRFYGR